MKVEEGQTNRTDAADRDGKGAASEALGISLTIGDLEPLGPQIGESDPLTVPAALHEALFGQPDPADNEGSPPLHSYAVLDAGKGAGLPEMLEASGLDHACLFTGDAARELRDVAPWIVRLEEGNRFVRGLFTAGDAPWELWGKAAGIFLRSRGSIDQIRAHLRKFTKVPDETGAWLYFRFWEPSPLRAYLDRLPPEDEFRQRWFGLDAATRIEMILVPDPARNAMRIFLPSRGIATDRATSAERFHLRPADIDAIRAARMTGDLEALSALIVRTFPHLAEAHSRPDLDRAIARSASRARDFGIRQKDNLFRFIAWDLHSTGPFERTDATGRLGDILRSTAPEPDKMRRLAERMTQMSEPAASDGPV
ncbi:DUF4123 domain-containing protein [Jannaschia aquimarina]|uniref:DUF4123 domain-containing protein n=1 Tax=Jannaschia aquimarina TaxID=935700 RepID=A0A0D1EIY1_9RHOB|nr:DUF4123 domain-containing protein [Jannaschia aquimarina]KIT16871.1 hypothetical protein jaqu_13690 [Jannaschia aquimarina]SNT12637.1 protein of unknown function [Jannaschia aquimarina]